MKLASKYFNWGNIIVVSILTALMYHLSPICGDDAMHLVRWQNIVESNCRDICASFWDYFIYHIKFDSPRFFNNLLPIFLAGTPKWIIDSLIGIVWGVTIILTCRLIPIKTDQILRVSILIAMLEIFLPWNNEMCTIAYAVNYIWSLPLILVFLYCFINKNIRLHPAILIMIGLITGWNHESYSLPLLVGIICWFILNRQHPNRQQLLLTIPMVITLTTLLSISITGRFHSHHIITLIEPKTAIYITITKMPLATTTIIATIGMAIFKSGRKKLANTKNGILPITFMAMLIAVCVGIKYFNSGDRLFWFAEFYAIISIFSLLISLFPMPLIRSKVAWPISIMISIVIITHLITANFHIHKIKKQIEVINKEYIMGSSTNVFYDMTLPYHTPILAWNKLGATTTYTLNDRWYWQCNLFGKPRLEIPVPIQLKKITANQLSKVPGNNPYYSFNGILVRPYDEIVAQPIQKAKAYDDIGRRLCQATITFSHGARKKIQLNLSPFTADDGTQWLYSVINGNDLQLRFCDIIEINP